MQKENTKLNFKGQHIFTGIDIGKKSWKTTILTEHYEHKTFTQPPNIEVLVNYLNRNFPGAIYHCAYEAGYSGFWIHDLLNEHGIDCIVVNPADVPTKNKEYTNKTDMIDSRKLARSLRNGEIDPIYVPNRSSLEDRSLVRSRYHFVKKLTRCKNQIKAFLNFYGINIPDDIMTNYWSQNFISWLKQLKLQQSSGDEALQTLLEELNYLRQIIARLTKNIRLLANQKPYREKVMYLRTIPGISTLSAMVILTELVDINRFATIDHLANYCGLVPGEHSSGEQQIITGISRRRNPRLRALLIECAWVAVRKDPALIMAFNRLVIRMPKNKAIIRIARKLLNRIRFVLKNEQIYKNCTLASEQ